MTPTRLVTEAALAAEQNVRAFIWRNHGHAGPALYGDDGEMQCKACRLWDYRRDPLSALLAQAELAVAVALPERPALDDRLLAEALEAAWDSEVHGPLQSVDQGRGYFQLRPAPGLAARVAAAYERLSRERA